MLQLSQQPVFFTVAGNSDNIASSRTYRVLLLRWQSVSRNFLIAQSSLLALLSLSFAPSSSFSSQSAFLLLCASRTWILRPWYEEQITLNRIRRSDVIFDFGILRCDSSRKYFLLRVFLLVLLSSFPELSKKFLASSTNETR